MTSLERVLTTLGHREPDRVPFFLLLTLHGAKELGLTIRDYFSRAENVVEGQLRLLRKYRHDCLYTFYHAAAEIEAWGGGVQFFDDGPPNAAEPLFSQTAALSGLTAPRVEECPTLQRVLETTHRLKERVGNEVPLIGVVMSPFSLPVMQLGFERYLNLLLEERDTLGPLLAANEDFCVAWANAQLAAGATAICYFDPVGSPTILPSELFRRTGLEVARRTRARIQGPVAVHLASGRAGPLLEDLTEVGFAAVGVSALEDLALVKAQARGRVTLLGNLNAIEMRRWSPAQTEGAVRHALRVAGPGGGFILAENHGEIPFQVPDEVLHTLSETVLRWGHYPLQDVGA